MLFLCRKQLRDFFNTTVLHETITQILDTFKSIRSPHLWVDYLMPEDARLHEIATASSSDNAVFPDIPKFDQLMVETRVVLSRYVFEVLSKNLLKG